METVETVEKLRQELALTRQRQAEAEHEAQQADADAQRFEEAMLCAKRELKALKANQHETHPPQTALNEASEDLRPELDLARSEVKKLKQDLRVAHARIDLLEERIFEANQATERAEQDAVEADKDAIMFEKHARSHEAKYHEAYDDIVALKAQLEALTSETARLTAENQQLKQQEGGEWEQQQQQQQENPSLGTSKPPPVDTRQATGTNRLIPPPKPQRSKSSEAKTAPARSTSTTPIKPPEAHALPKPKGPSKPSQPSPSVAAATTPVGERSNAAARPKVTPRQRPSLPTSEPKPKPAPTTTAAAPAQSAQHKRPGPAADGQTGKQPISQKPRSIIPTSTRVRLVGPTGTATSRMAGASTGGDGLRAKKKTGKEAMLAWCQHITRGCKDVELTNFSSSFADGMAFVAMLHHYFPSAIDLNKHSPDTRRENFTVAFKVADEKGGVYPLLDVEDMVTMARPDALSVMTYVSQLHKQLSKRG